MNGKDLQLWVFKDDRIVIPKKLQTRVIRWYHDTLLHPGETRTEATIAQHFYWKGLRTQVVSHCRQCSVCQATKKTNAKYGLLPAKREPEVSPWKTLCIDLIGPYSIGKDITERYKDKEGKWHTKVVQKAPVLHCLTMIDPATCWFDIVQISDKSSMEVAGCLESAWLNRYPIPTEVIADRGREFMGEVLRMLREDYNVKKNLITTRNPQANSICERAHQTVHNLLRTLSIHEELDHSQASDTFSEALTAVRKAINSTVHTTLNATPTQLVFGRDAFLPVGFEADWSYIANRKQRLIQQNNKRENAKRIAHTYEVGDRVRITHDPHRKHGDDITKGPFVITRVNDNGTVQLRMELPSGNAKYETWNIRQIRPCKGA